jgi:glycosyltransferase involved in cell wall biosynthesis
MNYTGRGFWDTLVVMTTGAQHWHKAATITSPYDGNPLHLTLFVPCHNQEATITATLDTIGEAMRIITSSYEIIVIDDASTDHSTQKLRQYIERHPGKNIVLRINKKTRGLAQNYVDAAFIGRGKYFRLIPGDNSEPMETMVDVLQAMGEADVVVPYFIDSMQEAFSRQLLSRSYTRLVNLLTGNSINDYHYSPIHLRFNVMRWHSDRYGRGSQVALLCRLLSLGFTCKQVPCRTVHRNSVTWKDVAALPPIVADAALRRLCGLVAKE